MIWANMQSVHPSTLIIYERGKTNCPYDISNIVRGSEDSIYGRQNSVSLGSKSEILTTCVLRQYLKTYGRYRYTTQATILQKTSHRTTFRILIRIRRNEINYSDQQRTIKWKMRHTKQIRLFKTNITTSRRFGRVASMIWYHTEQRHLWHDKS